MIAPPAWERPWLAPYAGIGREVFARLAEGGGVAQALCLPGAPRRFVPHAELPRGEAYESFVARCGAVPTRDNLHDLFNGLVWHRWAALKARLNTWQAEAIARDGTGPRRGALRDALTLFDESGAILDAPPELAAALRARRWRELFVGRRAGWRDARLVIVGHALLEQLATAPRKGLVAFAWLGDPLAADDLAAWATKPFVPLPVLGVPGWWAANHDPAFYDDAAVFRPARSAPA